MPLTDAALSVDSLVVGAAVAPLMRSGSHRLAAAALFGTADAVATSIGRLIVAPLQGMVVVAALMPALYGVYLLAVSGLAARGLRVATAAESPSGAARRHVPALAVLGASAVALSVDNLVAAATAHEASVAAIGCASALAALLGLTIG